MFPIRGPKRPREHSPNLYVFSAGHTARRARPEGARELSPGFTLGNSPHPN